MKIYSGKYKTFPFAKGLVGTRALGRRDGLFGWGTLEAEVSVSAGLLRSCLLSSGQERETWLGRQCQPEGSSPTERADPLCTGSWVRVKGSLRMHLVEGTGSPCPAF